MMKSIKTLKIVSLISFMGMGAYLPFARLFFEASPLTGGQYGILMSIPGYILLLSQPIWSIISDYTGSLKRNFQIMLAGSGLFLIIFFIAQDFFLENYIALIILYSMFALFYTGRNPILNSLALSYIENEKEGFGRFRLWPSVGWAIATITGGYIFYQTEINLLFPLAAFFFLISAITAQPLKEPKRKTLKTPNVFKSQEIRKALNNKKLWIFLILILILWTGVTSADIFVPAYLERHFEFNLIGLGIFFGIQALAEVPFFYHGDRIMKKIGPKKFLISGFGLFGLGWLIFGLITSVEMVFLVLFIRAIGYSFIVIGGVTYLDREVTEQTRTVGQSLFTISAFGFGAIIGPTLGGFLSNIYELPTIFIIGGAICLASTLGLVLFWSVTPNKK